MRIVKPDDMLHSLEQVGRCPLRVGRSYPSHAKWSMQVR